MVYDQELFPGKRAERAWPGQKLLPTVILPVDVKAIERLLDDENADDRASAFLEKTFDITFQVNRPVFTGWRRYLEAQMTSLFGDDLQDDWVYIASRILDRAHVEAPRIPITPRRINSLINRLGTQWMLRQDESISFAAVAYYCVFQSDFEADVLSAVLKPKMAIEVHDQNWKRSVAAIHFGVSTAVANEVLLDTPIRSALEKGARDEFAELARTAGFNDQMVRICESINENNTDPVLLLRIAVLLGTSSPDDSPALAEAWRQLREALPEDVNMAKLW